MERNKESLRDVWDNFQHINIHIIGIPGEEREKGAENIFGNTIAGNFPNMRKEETSKSRKRRESQRESTQRGPHKDTL